LPQVSEAEIELLESTKKPRKFVLFRLQALILRFNLRTEHYVSVQQLLSVAGAYCHVHVSQWLGLWMSH